MLKDKFEIGDIIKRKENAFDTKFRKTLYYKLQSQRHLKGQPEELIAFLIAKKSIPGTWIIRKENAIRVLGFRAAELFDSDKELLVYLRLLEKN